MGEHLLLLRLLKKTFMNIKCFALSFQEKDVVIGEHKEKTIINNEEHTEPSAAFQQPKIMTDPDIEKVASPPSQDISEQEPTVVVGNDGNVMH